MLVIKNSSFKIQKFTEIFFDKRKINVFFLIKEILLKKEKEKYLKNIWTDNNIIIIGSYDF